MMSAAILPDAPRCTICDGPTVAAPTVHVAHLTWCRRHTPRPITTDRSKP